MKEFKTAAIACFMLIVLGIASFSIYAVRQYLPIVGVVLLVVLIVGALLALAWGIEHIFRRFNRYDYRAIDQYGTVARRYNSVEVIAPYHQLPVARASRASQPEEEYIEADIEEVDEMPALLPRIPTFAEMLESGMVQAAISRGQMIIGFYAETHQPRFGSWLDLYSAGNGGVSGSGKSTTTRFLLFQAVMASAKLIMVDPHIGDPDESLSHQFSLLPASIHQIRPCDGRAVNVLKRVDWLSRELVRRKNTGAKTPALVFVIDEFNAQMRVKEVREELSTLLLDIEQEGRKFGIFALLIGQRWSAQDLGGADIRTSLSSKMGHRFSDEGQAVRFMGSKHGKKLLELETGHWLFYDTKGKTSEMVTPETLAQDGRMIGRILTGAATSEPTSEPDFITSEITSAPSLYLLPGAETDATTDAPIEQVDVPTDALTPQALRVLNMLREKRGQNEIIEEIWGFKSTDGRPYRAAVEEYRAVLATLASRIGA
jgi:hypothetical protein